MTQHQLCNSVKRIVHKSLVVYYDVAQDYKYNFCEISLKK